MRKFKSSPLVLFAVASLLGCSESSEPSREAEQAKFSALYSSYELHSVDGTPIALSIGDVNGDELNDVVLVTGYNFDPDFDYKLFVFLQGNSAELQAPLKLDTNGSLTNPLETVAIGDVNSDGLNEVIVAHLYRTGSTGEIEIFFQNSSNVLTSGLSLPSNVTSHIEVADANDDELPDIVSVDYPNAISLYPQNIGGSIDSPTTIDINHNGYDDLDIADVNNDGLNDILVMSGQGALPNFGVLEQNGMGFNEPKYYSVLEEEITHSLSSGDLNNDGLVDVVVGFGSSIGIFFQNENNELDSNISYPFLDPFSNSSRAIKVFDLNRDRKSDIVILHADTYTVETFLQTTDKGFVQELYSIPSTQSISTNAIGVGDINRDSLPDIVIATDEGLAVLYQE